MHILTFITFLVKYAVAVTDKYAQRVQGIGKNTHMHRNFEMRFVI